MRSEPGALVAYLFPGQGSQAVGMGRELYEAEPIARALWEEADGLLGFRLSKLAFDGPEAELQRTQNAQPALLVASIAALRVFSARGMLEEPAYLAGHSLGEYSALVAAGSLTYPDALRLVRLRGELMAAEGDRVGGAMSAVIGLDPDTLAEVCAAEGVDVANYNSPEQSVISGPADAVARAGARAKASGARRVLALPVSGAFHSELMRPVAGAFAGQIASTPIQSPAIPVVGNVRAQPLRSVDEVRRELVEQLYSPVRWLHSLQYMAAAGVTHFVEIGTGKVLTGLVKRTLPEATGVNSDSMSLPVNG